MRNRGSEAIASMANPPAAALAPSTNGQPAAPFAGTFCNRDRIELPLAGMFKGSSLFMMLSGPSLASTDFSLIDRRGIMTMGVNNSPSIYRTHLWTHSDPVDKFHHGIWRDPGIMKFTPIKYFGRLMRIKKNDGHFELTKETCSDQPNVVG